MRLGPVEAVFPRGVSGEILIIRMMRNSEKMFHFDCSTRGGPLISQKAKARRLIRTNKENTEGMDFVKTETGVSSTAAQK